MPLGCVSTLKTDSERCTNEIILENFEVLRRLYTNQLKTQEYVCWKWAWHYHIIPFFSSNAYGPSLRLLVMMNKNEPLPTGHLLAFKAVLIGKDGQSKASDCICLKEDGWLTARSNTIDVCEAGEASNFVVNGTLRIMVVVRHDWLVCSPVHQTCPTLSAADDETPLLKAVRSIYDESLFTDLEIVTRNKIFKANKCIVASRSPYFKALLCGDFKENLSNRVELIDVDGDDFESVLIYMYKGEIVLTEASTVGVLKLADRLLIDELKSRCASFLLSRVNAESVLDILQIACTYQIPEVKNKCFDFLRLNKEIMQTPLFKMFVCSNPEIASDLLSHFI